MLQSINLNAKSINMRYLLLFLLPFTSFAQTNPSFEQILSLRGPGTPLMSPDGQHILFTQTTTDWENNRYDTELWIIRNNAEPFQLTNNLDGSSSSAQWSPDSRWIAFESSRDNKNQVHVISVLGGEAFALTHEKDGIRDFQWSPKGDGLIYTKTIKDEKTNKREDRYGKFDVDEKEYELVALWYQPFVPGSWSRKNMPAHASDSIAEARYQPYPLIEDPDYFISDFRYAPDASMIAIDKRPDPMINSFFDSDIALYRSETGEVEDLVTNSSFDGFVAWSPDSKQILFSSAIDNRDSVYYANSRYFLKTVENGKTKEVATEFDENINGIEWTPSGIFGTAYQKTQRYLVELNPKSGNVEVVQTTPDRIYGFTLNTQGSSICFSGQINNELTEIFRTETKSWNPVRLTSFNRQLEDWRVTKSEVISWQSEDGATVEGVLHKPADFDPNRKYPLLVVIHGGPTGISTPHPTPAYVYPIVQWVNKGALVLRPNYRGSAGYGAGFRALNVRNLGVGDAWDVLSGVAHLEKQGYIDSDALGAMGWSQGGYISAFLTTNSDRFKAISVGAGISDWMTYYVNTDIHPFTRQYLKATPWEDPEIYALTSPMTNINKATTPTLIQHGEFDARVPIPNAYQLVQGLRDRNVPTELIVYKGFGHGISKPKERLAAMWHNWQWFLRYIWNEEIEVPVDDN